MTTRHDRPVVPSAAVSRRHAPLAVAAATCVATAGLLLAGAAATPGQASARVQVGVYQDNPIAGLPPLRTGAAGKKVRTVSTYLTLGKPLSAQLVSFANRSGVRLMISVLPDSGRAGQSQPTHRLKAITGAKKGAQLLAFGRQTRKLTRAPIVRLMPEMNTPWYAWSGTVNGNTPAQYVTAWKRARAKIRAGGGGRVKFLWAPYVRSIPDTEANGFAAYFPGVTQVDFVGVSGYNFGAAGSLAWAEPVDLFSSAYQEIQALAAKPFWIAETGSTNAGGDKSLWMSRLGKIDSRLPRVVGVVWYDVKEATGDFRIRQNNRTLKTWRAMVTRSAK